MAVCCGVRVRARVVGVRVVVTVREAATVRVAVATAVGLVVGDDVLRFVAVAGTVWVGSGDDVCVDGGTVCVGTVDAVRVGTTVLVGFCVATAPASLVGVAGGTVVAVAVG